MTAPLLDVQEVRHQYGNFEALKGVSFRVFAGEIFGLLGPNGAGKTTLLTTLAALRDATRGQILLEGKPLRRADREQRSAIGIATQDLAIYEDLTAKENLAFFGKLYGIAGGDLANRVDEVLELAGLKDRANHRAGTFSGGMKRRLNLGIAVMHRPKILFLDEPTTGVDPQSRNHIFERVQQLNSQGLTVVYTSHYMEEVQTLCNRIAILDHGRLIACDTLPGLLQLLEGTLALKVDHGVEKLAELVESIPGVKISSREGNRLRLSAADVPGTLLRLIPKLNEQQITLTGLETQEPNLERVFLHLTDRTLRD